MECSQGGGYMGGQGTDGTGDGNIMAGLERDVERVGMIIPITMGWLWTLMPVLLAIGLVAWVMRRNWSALTILTTMVLTVIFYIIYNSGPGRNLRGSVPSAGI